MKGLKEQRTNANVHSSPALGRLWDLVYRRSKESSEVEDVKEKNRLRERINAQSKTPSHRASTHPRAFVSSGPRTRAAAA